MPQLRQNPITGDWVVIAPERSRRPNEYVQAGEPRPKQRHTRCDFCLGGSVHAGHLVDFDTDHTYVIPNKFPAFVENPTACSPRSFPVEHNFFRARPSTGGHDVVVVNDGRLELPTFPISVWLSLLETFVARYHYFHERCGVEYTLPIYNHKAAAGASIEHPHAQIFATNILPNQVAREVHTSYDAFERHRRCVFCDLIHHENVERTRIIAENATFVAFTFYAARFPFELWVLPKTHRDRFEASTPTELLDLAQLMRQLTGQLSSKLGNPPLNFYIHSLPNSFDDADFFHWHLEITPRLSNYGGFELGSGVIIDMVSPEHAAVFLRGVFQSD